MTRADVIVIGGGANGASTAFHLASRGVKKVLLLERGQLAAGATGKSGSLVRMHYTNEPESRLAFESLKIFRDFRNVVGGHCCFEPIGFLQLVPKGYEAALARNVARQQGLEKLKPIFLALGEKVDYDTIRLVVSHLQSQNG